MNDNEERIEALRVLNKHFEHSGHSECLEDAQVKLVLDAMIEFKQPAKKHCDRCAGKPEVECNVLCDNCLLELRGI